MYPEAIHKIIPPLIHNGAGPHYYNDFFVPLYLRDIAINGVVRVGNYLDQKETSVRCSSIAPNS